jgi:hypothetical protein
MGRRRIGWLLVWTFAAGTLVLTPTLAAQTPVPSTVIHIKGNINADDGLTFNYRAYQTAGDPFRVICSEPCALNQNAIYGLYAGFKTTYQTLIALFGVPAAASAQPFDLHVDTNHWCGPPPTASGESFPYPSYSGLSAGSYGCFWFDDAGHQPLAFSYPNTTLPAYHLITGHEFTHTMFFGRHKYSYEDFAVAMSYYISNPDTGLPLTDPCDDALNTVGSGKLVWDLCQRSGFQYSDLAPAFIALDNAYQAGNWQAVGTTSVFQFRRPLAQAAGSNTLDAFLTSKFVKVPEVGDNATVPSAGGRVPLLGGWVSLLAAPGAVAADQPLHIDGVDSLPYAPVPAGLMRFENMYRVSHNNSNLYFPGNVYVQLKYDPSLLDFGTDESTLKIYKTVSGPAYATLADSRVDPAKMTISGTLTSATDFFFVVASSTTVTPTLVVPRAVSNANVHTHLVLRNSSKTSKAGKVTFHPQGVAASASDPSVSYSLARWDVLVLDDAVAGIGGTGAGSIDITATSGTLPDAYAVDVETGTSTFPGAIVPVHTAASALAAGDRAVLLAPGNLQRQTFGFVVRTFGAGATLTVTTRDPSGAIVATTPLTYAANSMAQVAPTTFTGGAAPVASESFDVTVSSGSAIIEIEEGSHGMASHNYRLAERVDLAASTTDDVLHLPKAIGQANADGTTVRTAVQLMNPGTSTITGKIRFKPASGATPTGVGYSIPPGATKVVSDFVTQVGQTGSGAIDLQSTGGNLPIAVARVIYSGNSTPWQVADERAHDVMELLQAGDRAVVVSPLDTTKQFLIGVRTLARPLAVTITLFDNNGIMGPHVTKTFPAQTSSETDASTLMAFTVGGGYSLEITVDGGSGLLYGTAVNPATGALNFQPVRRLPYY